MCVACVCQGERENIGERENGFPQVGVAGTCELSDMGAGNQSTSTCS